MGMEISGPRVRCANCGFIYVRPPTEKVFWIGVPFRVIGFEKCPKCSSNAYDIVYGEYYIEITDNTSDTSKTITKYYNDENGFVYKTEIFQGSVD